VLGLPLGAVVLQLGVLGEVLEDGRRHVVDLWKNNINRKKIFRKYLEISS
jgi:hypothetical protein